MQRAVAGLYVADPIVEYLLDLVAVSIACDIVPMTGDELMPSSSAESTMTAMPVFSEKAMSAWPRRRRRRW